MKKEHSYNKSLFFHCKDKEKFHHSYYTINPIGFELVMDEDNNILEYRLCDGDLHRFPTAEDTFDYLLALTATYTKETLLVYTDNLNYALAIIPPKYEYNKFGDHSITVFIGHGAKIEIRNLESFTKDSKRSLMASDITYAEANYIFAKNLIKNLFIPCQKAFLTVHQYGRWYMQDLYKNSGEYIKDTIPPYAQYKKLVNCKKGGFCYNNAPQLLINKPIIGADRVSCYPYTLLTYKFPNSAGVIATDTWRECLFNAEYCCFGNFDIKYSSIKHLNYLSLYPEFKNGTDTVNLWLTETDFLFIIKCVEVVEVKCHYLIRYEAKELPNYLIDVICNLYKKKKETKYCENWKYEQAKLELNSITGNLQRNIDSFDDYWSLKDFINPAWGVWLTSYCRTELLLTVEKLDGVIYGDTDSVYCLDTPQNRQTLSEVNFELNQRLQIVCENRGLDYNLLKGLGEFEIEKQIIKFRANKTKQYGYQTIDGDVVVKASGYEKDTIDGDYFLKTGKMPTAQSKLLSISFGKVEEEIVNFGEYLNATIKNDIVRYANE